jgi:hypothetical protein
VSDRPKGVVVYRSPKNPIADEAKKHQLQLQRQRQERAAARAARPVPNYICYQDAFRDYDPKTGRWKGGSRRVPKCRVCECNLPPMETHKCEGFKPKYVEHDEAWHERMEARREAIREAKREAKRNGLFFSEDEDDLSGYEDEPEEDWCDEDDGDPMWE